MFARNMSEYLETVGIQDIKQDHCSVPMAWGPPDIAAATRAVSWCNLFVSRSTFSQWFSIYIFFFFFHLQNYEVVFSSLKPQLTISIGLAEDHYDELVEGAEKELGVVKGFCNVYYACGRKPLDTNPQNWEIHVDI